LLAPDRLRALLERHLAFARLEEAKSLLPRRRNRRALGRGGLPLVGARVESVLASAAIPAIFPPVQIAGRQLSDGALASNTPLSAALGLGAERLVVLPTGFSCTLKQPPPLLAGDGAARSESPDYAAARRGHRPLLPARRRSWSCRALPLNVSSGDFSHSPS